MKALHTRLFLGATALFYLTVLPIPAQALIIIEPIPHQPPNHHALQLTENNVHVKITNRVAEVTAEFIYHNSSRIDLEGTFLFPLPAEAAVDDFSLFVNGEEIKAELLDHAQARRIYERIVRRRKDPALLEFADRQLLRARVFPITPQDGAKIRLYYTHPVPADFGTADFVYPLSVEKLEAGSGCKITIDVEISSSKALKTVYSPTHTIDLSRPDDQTAKVSCVPVTAGQRAADFHLLAMTAEEKVAANFLTCQDKDGVRYFMGMISPGIPESNEILPKDVVFCLDRSGSMEGEKIKQAKAALRFCVNRLNADDRFGLVIFNSDIEIFRPALSPAKPEARQKAIEFFEKLPATGGTFIDGALGTSLEMFENSHRPKYLVFLTDGLPTVGTRKAQEILRHATEKNHHGARVFAWGVGYDLNAALLNDLADQGRGVASYVEPGQDIEVEVSHFFERINRPVLADCRLDIEGVTITEMYPRQLPDLFAGSEVIVVGRYAGNSPVTVTLTGRQGSTFKQFVFSTSFKPHRDKYSFLPKLWAGRRIGYLLEDMRRHGENREVIDEVVTLSKKYGIMTPYTSFLAAPEEPRFAADGRDREYGLGGSRDGKVVDLMDVTSTRRTIASKKLLSAPTSEAPEISYFSLRAGARDGLSAVNTRPGIGIPVPPQEPAYKTAGGKTFVLRDDVWIDADLLTGSAPADTIKIEKFSDAYFELLRAYPEFADYLSVGHQVIVLYNGVVILVADTGQSAFRREWEKLLN